MRTKKRRPTSTSKSQRLRTEGGSHMSQSEVKPTPSASKSITRKYYYSAIQEEERHQAHLLTRFLAGSRTNDQLSLGELLSFYSSGEHLVKTYEKPQVALRWAITDSLQAREKPASKIVILCPTQALLRENLRKKRELLRFGCSYKKEELKSTELPSRKQVRNILGVGICTDRNLNESLEFGKLSKCLKKALKINNCGKGYKSFMAEMERKGEGRDKDQGMLNMIMNLEKDFSSIHEDGSCSEMDKEAVYGLSELKRKSDKNTPKLEHKPKEKTSIRFTHLNFIKKQVSNFDSANSTSKHSTKSISTRKSKPQNLTPDNHRIKSKSKSMKKKPSKNLPDKKSKLTDTQKLYYDERPQKVEQKELKSSLREGTKKIELHGGIRSKKKIGKT